MPHTLSNYNPLTKLATCSECGPNSRTQSKHAGRRRCFNSGRAKNHKKNGYRNYLKSRCENSECGWNLDYFPGILDVHHIDENHANNSPENLMTLCKNCHGLIHLPNFK